MIDFHALHPGDRVHLNDRYWNDKGTVLSVVFDIRNPQGFAWVKPDTSYNANKEDGSFPLRGDIVSKIEPCASCGKVD